MRVFLTVFLLALSLLSWVSGVDESALEIYNETFDRAVYSFALAKGLNAVISVLQSSEVNLSFFVGATIGVGQILDPINDLVERFSMIMLISSISLGVQHLLLLLANTMFLKVVLGLSTLIVLFGIWRRKLFGSNAFAFFMKMVILLIVLRFFAVVSIHANYFLYNELYAQEYQNSTKYISEYKSNLEILQQDQKQLKSALTRLERKSELFSKEVIQLITIFIITTVLFPLIFIWFFVLLLRLIFSMKVDYDIILFNKIKGNE